jgi:ACT domain-containing protein
VRFYEEKKYFVVAKKLLPEKVRAAIRVPEILKFPV